MYAPSGRGAASGGWEFGAIDDRSRYKMLTDQVRECLSGTVWYGVSQAAYIPSEQNFMNLQDLLAVQLEDHLE